jgi:hypothetical protein
MNVNGSVTPKLFYLTASAGQMWVITHLHVTIACGSNPAMNDFGNIAGGLVNGMAIQASLNSVVANPLGTFTFKKNYHFGLFSTPDISNYSGSPQTLSFFVNVIDTDSPGIGLNGNTGDYYGFKVQDNLTALADMAVAVYGERFSL